MMLYFPLSTFRKSLLTASLLALTACGGSPSSDPDPIYIDGVKLQVSNDQINNVGGRSGVVGIDVLANDNIDGQSLSSDLVVITQVSADSPLSISDDGKLSVQAMTPQGDYSLEYQVCLQSNSDICTTATVNVQVLAGKLSLSADSINGLNGGITQGNIVDLLANDKLDANVIDAADVTFSISEQTLPSAFSITDSQLSLLSPVDAGEYQLTYNVCENLNPENCASQSLTVLVDKGVFMDGAAGVKYISDSFSGVTDAQGGYQYNAGDNISFYIGDSQLGESVAAKAQLSPLDIVPGSFIPETVEQVEQVIDTYWKFEQSKEMSELVNILVMLYSFDADRNFNNGIAINPELHSIMTGIPFNTKQQMSRFRSGDHTYENALYKAFDNGLVAHAHRIRYWLALDLFAAANNIEPPLYVQTKSARDYENDGHIDSESSVAFDERGFFAEYVSKQYELNGENNELVSEFKDIKTYNDFGRELSSSNYENSELTYQNISTRNIHGKTVQSTWLNVEDNSTDIIIFERDHLGNTIRVKADSQADGTTDFLGYSEYDSDGNETLNQFDHDGDGIIDEKYVAVYENGFTTREEYYNDGDATPGIDEKPYRIITYVRDNNGDVLTQTHDHKNVANENYADGIAEQISKYQFDQFGNRVLQEDFIAGSETPRAVYKTNYDAQGRYLGSENDYDGDGTLDYVSDKIYDENGNIIADLVDYNSSTEGWDYKTLYQYNENNQMLNRAYYNGQNAENLVNQTHYTYDENGNNIREEQDHNADGKINRVIENSFDENNQKLTTLYDDEADGSFDQKLSYESTLLTFMGWYQWDD